MTTNRELARGAHKIADVAARLNRAALALERELLEEPTHPPALTDKPRTEPTRPPPRQRAPKSDALIELTLIELLDLEAHILDYERRPRPAEP